MSLRSFHVVFIAAATLLALFCAAQAWGAFRVNGSPVMAAASVMALSAAVALVRYETLFLRRWREAGFR